MTLSGIILSCAAVLYIIGFSGDPDVKKKSACNAGDLGLIHESGRSPGDGNGNPLQYSCLGNPWIEEPRGLQAMGLQRVEHDRATNPFLIFCVSYGV